MGVIVKILACILQLVIVAGGQTAQSGAAHKATLEEVARSVTPTGTITGTNKKISELKISDLPDAVKDPLSMETTFKCVTLAELAIANEQQPGAIVELVPQDVLEATPNAVYGCLAFELNSLPADNRELIAAHMAALTDAAVEMNRREYNRLVGQYNALLAAARNLQNQLLAVQMQNAQRQQLIDALALYQLIPKYTPPQTINVRISDCTRLPALCVH